MDSKRRLLILYYATYFMTGLILGMRTNIFLFVQQEYLEGYKHLANLILFSGIAMQFSLYLTGNLIERFGFQRVLPLGISISGLSLSFMYLVNSAMIFDICFFLFMVGFGIIIFNLNLFVSYLNPERKGNALLVLHLFFAIGALIGPKLVSTATDLGHTWQLVTFISSFPFYILLFFLLTTNKEHNHGGIKDYTKKNISPIKSINNYFKDIFVWLFIVVFLCAQVWEYGLGTWFVLFANKAKGLNSGQAAFYLTIFYFTYPIVRVIFAKLIHKFDLIVVLIGAFISCLLFSSLGMFTGYMTFYSLTGLGIALTYPALIAAMQLVFGHDSLKKISFVTMTGGLLQYIAIWSVGLISDKYGIVVGFNSMIIYIFIGLIFMISILYFRKTREGKYVCK